MNVSEHHFLRLLRRYREKGDAGLVSAHRGRPGNKRMGEEKQQSIFRLMLATYQAFGRTLASEKRTERDGIQVSKEAFHQILPEEGRIIEDALPEILFTHPKHEQAKTFLSKVL